MNETAGDAVAFDRVTVTYRNTVVLDDFSLDVRAGEFMALIGPSGSGKTTALRTVAGFVKPSRGRVLIGGNDVTGLPPYRRDLGMVVQNYALFPHMRVDENVAFGLRARRVPRAVLTERVMACLDLVGMAQYARRLPRELSGGQQQRVAIARALAVRPRVLLLDEPLSALDAPIRRAMVGELTNLHRELPSLTVLYVTHDQSEALALADRIAVVRDGRLCSHGSARALYRRPPNRFTAEFLGRANVIPVSVESYDATAQRAIVRFGGGRFAVTANDDAAQGSLVCIRPHDLRSYRDGDENRLAATVVSADWQGDRTEVTLSHNGLVLRAVGPPLADTPDAGSVMELAFSPKDASLIAETNA